MAPSNHGPSPPGPPSDGSTPGGRSSPLLRAAEVIRIVSNPDRLRLLVILGDGERTVSELVARSPGLSDQFVSRHLGILRHNGLVEDLTAGAFRIYKLTEVGARLLRAIRGLDAP